MTVEMRARLIYRTLLRAYPKAQRTRYGAEMEDAFIVLLHLHTKKFGWAGAARCWIGAAMDVTVRGLVVRFRYRTQAKRTRKSREGEIMGTIVSDVRYALRSLSRRPAFALTAILTIAIGIGANASVFTVVNGLVLEPLPYEDPDGLVAIWSAQPSLGWSRTDVVPADAMDWRARATLLEDLAVLDNDGFNLTGGDAPELVSAIRVTPNYLSLIGRQPVLGRDFNPEEIGDGADGVVILTDPFWERRFARDRNVLGSTLLLDGEAVVVVGIMPPDFLFHDARPDLLRPWGYDLASSPRGSHGANAIARLAQGVELASAREELEAIAEQLASEHPENEGWTVQVVSLHSEVLGPVAGQASVVLMGAVGFILLMACVNVANLLLARAGGRSREMAVRVALGAGRRRVIRQLLTESLVLALIGGTLGVVSAQWGYRAIVSALPSFMPPVFQFDMDRTVLVFTAGITVGAALLFGLLPAVRTASVEGSMLRDGGRAGTSRGASHFGSALVVMQTAMAVVLLVGGGLLMKSISGMRSQDFGFDPEQVLTARVALPQAEYGTREQSEAYWIEVAQRIREVPGVMEAGTTQSHPLMGSNWGRTVRIAGQDFGEDQTRTVRVTYASPGLFEALRFGMVRGRVFSDADVWDAPPVAIVNVAFVDRYLAPGDDPLQQTMLDDDWSASIVGVVHDVIERAVDDPVEPAMYLPISQADIRTRSLVTRTLGEPTDVVADIQAAVWSVDRDIPVYNVQTMTDLVDERVGGFAVIGYLMGVFAVLSLVLGAVGIYGVTAYAAGQRRSEIGVRLAMGAERTDVVGMVVRQGARRTAIGLVIGLGLALALGGAMSGILIGVSPRDPLTFGTVIAVLGGVSFLGLYLPARQASRVDPVRALASD